MVPRDAADRRQPGGQAEQADDAQTSDLQRRAAIRRFALAHHPDRGGDPAVFDAGLRALRAGPGAGPGIGLRADSAGVGRPSVTVYRRRGPVAVVAAWAVRRWSRWKRLGRRGRSTRVQ